MHLVFNGSVLCSCGLFDVHFVWRRNVRQCYRVHFMLELSCWHIRLKRGIGILYELSRGILWLDYWTISVCQLQLGQVQSVVAPTELCGVYLLCCRFIR